ncbi:MAG: ABC transporter substrate-binding protein [Candidatus Tectomicrobia bacterium]|nr:ABC transporter substrate-binding protein [Candidatus Tectomicrobia bacterium]
MNNAFGTKQVDLRLFVVGLVALLTVLRAGAAGAGVGKPTGELRIALAFLGAQRFVPWVEVPSGGIKHYQILVYDYLVGCTDDGQLSAEGGIAQEWQEAADKLSWTFTLRKGVTFHDGTELTAEDVKFSIDSLFDPKAVSGLLGPTRTAFKAIEIINPWTVVVQLKQPAVFLPWNFPCATGSEGMILPKKYFQQVGADGFAKNPIGSGPYKVAKNTLGASIQLEALTNHWRDGTPRFRTVTFLLVPEESTRLAQLRTGEADLIAVSRERVPEIKSAGFNVFSKLNDQVVAVYMQQQWDQVPIADKRVRQALNLAIDKEALIKFVFAGQGVPVAMYPVGSYGVAGGADPTLKPYPYDPQRARQLLAEAGYPNGFETKIYSYVTGDLPELNRLSEAVADYLAQVGVKARITPLDRAALSTKRQARTLSGDLLPWSTPNRSLAIHIVSIINALHHSKAMFSSTADPELDRLIERALAATDVREAERLVGDMHRFLYDHANNITIGEIHTNYATNQKIAAWDLGRNLYDINLRYLIRQ